MYSTGTGVPKDYEEALKWYKKAAEQGNSNAQYNLGFMYGTGTGVPKDYVLAYRWYSLAVAQGDKISKDDLNNIIKEMTPAQIAEAQKLSREFKVK
jgi:TPR repeat protein